MTKKEKLKKLTFRSTRAETVYLDKEGNVIDPHAPQDEVKAGKTMAAPKKSQSAG